MNRHLNDPSLDHDLTLLGERLESRIKSELPDSVVECTAGRITLETTVDATYTPTSIWVGSVSVKFKWLKDAKTFKARMTNVVEVSERLFCQVVGAESTIRKEFGVPSRFDREDVL